MAAATTATAKTVSQPLQLDAADSTSEVNGNKRRRIVKPNGKITLTSLTENNVSTSFAAYTIDAHDSQWTAWHSEEDYQRSECFFVLLVSNR